MRSAGKATMSAVLLVSMILSGCAWQRIPAAPSYAAPSPLPLRVGVVLADTPASAAYGPGVVKLWEGMGVFKAVTYPYRDGDPVDAVLRLTVNGQWKGHGAGAGIIVGLTLGIASVGVGPSMTGVHDAAAALSKDAQEIAKYVVRAESTVKWGMQADATDVGNKADDLQRRKIAVELAQKLEADRAKLLKALGK